MGGILCVVVMVRLARVVRMTSIGGGLIGTWAVGRGIGRALLKDSDVDDHVVAEVLVPCDEGISILILKTNPLRSGRTGVEPIKVLDSGHNGVGSIMRVNLHTHGQARTILGGIHEQKLKCDVLGDHCLSRRHGVRRRGSVGHAVSDMRRRH
jgi:hypothetical protein